MKETTIPPLQEWLAQAGFPEAVVAASGDQAILALPAAGRNRLLLDGALRERIVAQAKSLGFSRLCLEIPSDEKDKLVAASGFEPLT